MAIYRILCFSVMLFFGVGGAFVATEYVAYNLSFRAFLGSPTAHFLIPIYSPFSVFRWIWEYYNNYPRVFDQAIAIFTASGLCGFVGIGFLSIVKHRHGKTTDTHGTARWARRSEIKKMGLASKEGVVLGRFPGIGLLRHFGPEHILINAPTRSGKGVSIVVPTLLSWPASVLVLDIKKENWDLTSGFRKRFTHAICFDPTSSDGARWNPLLEVRKGVNEIRDAQNIADILVDPDGSKKSRNIWENNGHALLVATILHILYAEKDKTLSGIAKFLANPDRGIYDTLAIMKKTNHLGSTPHPVVASTAQEMLNKCENELSGVVSTVMSLLGLYRDPLVARNTETCDFRINDLMNAKYPVSLYLVAPAGDIGRLTPLNRMMINMTCRRLTEATIGAEGSPHKHRLLLLLDEFPSLGRMDFFRKSLGYTAGYGIKCMLVCQSYNNIYEYYGIKNSIFDNCHIRATMAPNDNDTARAISDSLGKMTVKRHQINFMGRRLAPWLSNISVADQETGRNLLNPDEVQKLPDDRLILMVAKSHPVLAKKIFYYKDKPFKDRLEPAFKLNKEKYPDAPERSTDDWFEASAKHEESDEYKIPDNEQEQKLQPDEKNRNTKNQNIAISLEEPAKGDAYPDEQDVDFQTTTEATEKLAKNIIGKDIGVVG